MKLAIVCVLVSAAMAAPAGQSLTFLEDGAYRFYYETGEEGGGHSRSEIRHPDGLVTGKFSYQDSDGYVREVHYRADESGFVAEGDVGVKGAPKGRFPVLEDNEQQEHQRPTATTEPPTPTTEEDPPEPPGLSAAEDQQQQQRPTQSEPSDVDRAESRVDDDDDMQVLSLDRPSAADQPPEGFPPGFFLNYHGLRRLPEPTKKAARPTTSTTTTSTTTTESPRSEAPGDPQQGDDGRATATTVQPGEFSSYAPWYRFYGPPRPHHSQWADEMFHHAPVYVFSYQQPNGYGYHYHF